MERGKTFTRFQSGWEFIPNDGCSNRESTLAQVQFSSWNKKLLSGIVNMTFQRNCYGIVSCLRS